MAYREKAGGIFGFRKNSTANKLTISALAFLFAVQPLYPAWAVEEGATITEPSVVSAESQVTTIELAEPTVSPEAAVPTGEAVKKDVSADEATPIGEESPAAMQSSAVQPGGSDSSLGNPSTIKQIIPQPDLLSGAFTYDYPIAIPPGRNGLQPELKMSYNSQAIEANSFFGAGWSVSIPSIERINRKGTDKLYTENYFNSTMGGELIQMSGGLYGSKVDKGDSLDYTLSGNTWTIRDKSGTTYTFGASAASRQDDPNNSSRVYKWMLEEIRDTNDNFVSYEYYKDQGQIYPQRVTYTGYGTTIGSFEVEFTREPRPDTAKSYATGFTIVTGYRINEVQVKVDGGCVRKYSLSFVRANNDRWSLLDSVTEFGSDEQMAVSERPPISFDYQEVQPEDPWIAGTGWTLPVADLSMGTMMVDVNGDSLADIMKSYCMIMGSNYQCFSNAYLNNGQGSWTDSAVYAPPLKFADTDQTGKTVNLGKTVAIDVNGDGLTDLVGDDWIHGSAYLNSGNGWIAAPQWTSPLLFNEINTFPHYAEHGHVGDLNGDGLSDIFRARNVWNGSAYVLVSDVYLNNGDGWTYDDSWAMPLELNTGSFIADLNGDGLSDVLQSFLITYRSQPDVVIKKAYINQGDKTFVEDPNFTPPVFFSIQDPYGYQSGENVTLADANGDGLVDILSSIVNQSGTYINTGHGWAITMPSSCSFIPQPSAPQTCRTGDVNGDGMVDLVRAYLLQYGGIHTDVYLNSGKKVDLLSRVTYPYGGKSDVAYRGTPQFRSYQNQIANPNLSFEMDAVQEIVNDDGFGGNSSWAYQYEGGRYYFVSPFDRKFAGFGKVTKTDSDGNKTRTYFHQGDGTDSGLGEYDDHIAKAGKPYRTEVTDSEGNPYATTVSKWDRADLGDGRSFVKLARKVEMAQDGDATHRDKAETYAYDDATGNLTAKTEWGEVAASADGTFTDVGTDNFTTSVSYAASVGSDVTGLPSQETVTDHSAAKVSEARHYYDALALGSVDKGNETKAERWVSGTSYVDTEKAYDGYGLVTLEKDALDNPTGYAYDAFSLYPATVTDALDRETSYLYDYSAGRPRQVTDQNGRVFQTVFDGLDRVTAERQPDAANPTTLVDRTTYAYTSLAVGDKVRRTDWLDGSTGADSLTYTDGLGRVIQERRPAGIANAQAVTDTVYNNRGLVAKKSLPYFSSVQPHSIHCERAPSGITATVTGPLLDGTALIATPPNPVSLALGATGYGWPSQVTAPWRADSVTHEIAIPADVSSFNLYLNDAAVTGDFWLKLPPNAGAPWTASGACAMGAYEISVLPGATPVVPTSDASLYTVFSYDPLQRVIAAADAVGTTTTAYDGWKTTVTDVSGHAKDYFRDAYGRLVRVDEHDGAATHATAYAYDYLGDLTGLTDALGNVRALTYDGLGRRLTAEDLHAPADQTFGSWSYAYDAAGNLVQRTDARGQVVDWTYDEINRPLTEDWAGGAGVEVTNTYDSGTDGLGRLTGVATADVTKSLAYNALGQLTSETATVDAVPYVTTRAYDRQGHETLTTSPDGSQVKNAYNAAGLVESVQRKESGDANWSDVVTNYDYAPTGLPTVIEYASAAVTTNTYDAAHLYRLARKLTTANGANVQDIAYAYDAVGNVTQLVDDSPTQSWKSVVYGYDDLDRLVSSVATRSGLPFYGEQFTYGPTGNLLTKTTTDEAGELVPNGGFEDAPAFTAAQTAGNYIDGTAAGSAAETPFHWHAGFASAGGSVRFDDSEAYGGGQSLKLHGNAGGNVSAVSNDAAGNFGNDPTQRFPVVSGHAYRLSYRQKTANMAGDSNEGAFGRVYLSKADGSELIDSAGVWPFGFKTDLSGNGHALSVNPAYVTAVAGVDGRANGAYRFDGTDVENKVSVPSSSALYEEQQTTISLWMKPEDTATIRQYVASHYNWNVVLGTTDNAGKIYFTVRRVGSTSFPTVISAAVPQGEWTHVAAVISMGNPTGNYLKVFLNGVLSKTTALGDGWELDTAYGSQNLQFGNSHHGSAGPYLGGVADARIYSRALSADEISWLAAHPYERAIQPVKTDSGWTRYATDYLAPAGAAWGGVGLSLAGGTGAATLQGDAWFDDVSVVDLTEAVAPDDGQLITNADLEEAPSFVAEQAASGYIDGTAGGSPSNVAYGWYLNKSAGAVAVRFDDAEEHSGGYAMKIHAGPEASAHVISNLGKSAYGAGGGRFPVIPGHRYRATVWMRTANTSGTTAKGFYGSLRTTTAAGGNLNSQQITGSIKTDIPWTKYEITHTAAEGEAWGAITLTVLTYSGETFTGDAWFDDVSVVDLDGEPAVGGDMTYTYSYAGDQGASYANPHAVTGISYSTGAERLMGYDENGNMTSDAVNNASGNPVASLSRDYTWDYANRLVSSATGVHASAYAYDAGGARVKLLEDGVTTIFPSGGYEVTAGVPTKQIDANGVTVATVVGTGADAVPRYVHTDHLTGSNVLTDDSGAIVETLDYYPYGGLRIDAGSYNERRKYAGHEYDQATGLSYMGARYYDAGTGRFLSEDPMFLNASFSLSDPQSLNAYSYARNNPLVYIDPDGRAFVPSFASGVARGFGGAFMSLGNAGANFLGSPIASAQSMAASVYNGASGTLATIAGYASNPGQLRSDLGAFGQLGNMAQSLSSDQIAGIGGQLTGQAMFVAVLGKTAQSASDAVIGSSPTSTWGNQQTLQRHFDEHGADFGANNPADYAGRANQFFQDRGNYNVKIGPDGVTRVYDSKTNTFGSYNPDGTTKTYYKPSSPTYFERQQSVDVKKIDK